VPTATGANDNCGYLANSFYESVFMCGIYAMGGGTVPAQVQAFMNDEWPMTLGCATTANPVSPSANTPTTVFYPETGSPTCTDPAGRYMPPSLYITDITNNVACKAGDQQAGGTPFDPVMISGVWSVADAGGTPQRFQPSLTYWNLGAGADPVPASAQAACPCTQGNCTTSGHTGLGYAVEARFEAGLVAGHTYRLQVIGHDGDQTQGGDAGEACVIFCSGGGACVPTGCAEGCGLMPDGCGGIIDCGPCCVPVDCETACASSSGPTCHSTYDPNQGWIMSCPQADGCGSSMQCWCPGEAS
jgi:hypothetical protein